MSKMLTIELEHRIIAFSRLALLRVVQLASLRGGICDASFYVGSAFWTAMPTGAGGRLV